MVEQYEMSKAQIIGVTNGIEIRKEVKDNMKLWIVDKGEIVGKRTKPRIFTIQYVLLKRKPG